MDTANEHTRNSEHCIEVCNSLLRGELSAIETYGQAIHKFTDTRALDELRRIRTEHIESAHRLSTSVREMGGTPETSSGAWGTLATTVQGAANLFGTGSAMESLQRGEEMGRNGYEEAMRDDGVMPEMKVMIRDELLPSTGRHIAALERLARSEESS